MRRRIVIFFIVITASLTSFLPVKTDNQLFLRNHAAYNVFARNVVNAASLSAHPVVPSSQIEVLGIGTAKADEGDEWGQSKQVASDIWTIKVGRDAKNATAPEILVALNAYRQRHGRGVLSWDDGLGAYAEQRAHYFTVRNDLDEHGGFVDFVQKQDGFHKLGFGKLGENSSYGYFLEAVHLIEWVYAGDKPHDDNQLSSEWTAVGIGVDGTATDLIFGGKKL